MDVLKIGQKLSISFEKEGKLVEITCTITNVYDDRLAIELPEYFMRYIDYLEVGKRLTIKVFSKIGTLDFNTIIISSPLEDEFAVELDYNAMKLTPNEEIPVITAVETININVGETPILAKTFEIAPEYIKFYSDKKFELGQVLDCALILPKDYGTIYFKGSITHIDELYEGEYKLSDFCMTEDDRQTLLYYMYVYANDTEWED